MAPPQLVNMDDPPPPEPDGGCIDWDIGGFDLWGGDEVDQYIGSVQAARYWESVETDLLTDPTWFQKQQAVSDLADWQGRVRSFFARRRAVGMIDPSVPVIPSRHGCSPVERLPYDVLFVICRQLGYGDILRLSVTNRDLRAFLDPSSIVQPEVRLKFYHDAERWAKNKANFMCYSCWRMRPRHCFADRHLCRGRGKYPRDDRFKSRHCWDCTATLRLLPENQPLRKDKALWYLCHRCGKFSHASQRCPAPLEDGSIPACTPVWPLTVATSPLEQLPNTLQARIVSELPYLDRIHLAATNRHFRASVDPQAAPLHEKAAFVRTRLRYAPGTYYGLPCLACFRVRRAARFGSKMQGRLKLPGASGEIDPRWWTIRCAKCCMYALTRPDVNAEWFARQKCFSCGAIKHKGEVCGACRRQGGVYDRRLRVSAERSLERALRKAENDGFGDGRMDVLFHREEVLADDNESEGGQEQGAEMAKDVAPLPSSSRQVLEDEPAGQVKLSVRRRLLGLLQGRGRLREVLHRRIFSRL